MKKILIILAVLVFSTLVVAQQDTHIKQLKLDFRQEIQQIRQIQAQLPQIKWTPNVTSISRLSFENRVQLCGLRPNDPLSVKALELNAVVTDLNPLIHQRLTEEHQKEVNKTAPRETGIHKIDPKIYRINPKIIIHFKRFGIDLRNYGIITPVKNQGGCGSCWAFAMISCVEAVNGGHLDLSEQELVSCCNTSYGCGGGYIASTAQWIINHGGVVQEGAYPYAGVTGTCNPALLSGLKYKISSYVGCSTNDAIKCALRAGYPVDTAMKVYNDFFHYTSGVYHHVTGGFVGNHAVCIVGYNDLTQCWIVKNSWGTGWGESGYFRIAYNECDIPWMAIYVKK